MVEQMFSTETTTDWSASFLKENQSRIQKRANRLTQLLDELEVPYLEPDSGLFLWMDLSQFLPDESDEITDDSKKERTLYLEII